MYSWSPNWLRLFSRTIAIASLSSARTAIAALLIPHPSPSPAPGVPVSQLKRWPFRTSSSPMICFKALAAAQIIGSSLVVSSLVVSLVSVEFRCVSARNLSITSSIFRCSSEGKRLNNLLNASGSLEFPKSRSVKSFLDNLSAHSGQSVSGGTLT